MSTMMMDGAVHMADLMNLQVDPDAGMVDPQLQMQYFTNLGGGKQAEPMTIDPTLWQTPIDTSQRFDIVQPQGYQPEDANLDLDDDDNSPADSPPYETRTRAAKTTRTASKSSVPSLSSGSSGSPESPPSKHSRPRSTKKQDSKPARKKQKTSKKELVIVDDEEDEEDDSKRNKYLERNRVAASKCRQKKKVWVSDLETTKSELERKHHHLQREYTTLVDEVTQLKNQLMAHAGCGDSRIDGWIETEAKRFVARTAEHEEEQRRLSAASGPRNPSLSDSSVQQQPSPTMSNGAFPQSPVIKEEMNFDHMPDNMFE